MGSLNILLLLGALAVGIALAMLYYNWKSNKGPDGKLTPEGYEKVREIVTKLLTRVYSLVNFYLEKDSLPREEWEPELINILSEEIYTTIQSSTSIPEADKALWTLEQIKIFVTPAIRTIIDKVLTSENNDYSE